MKIKSIIIFIQILFLPIYINHVIVLFKIRNFYILIYNKFIQNPILKRNIKVILEILKTIKI